MLSPVTPPVHITTAIAQSDGVLFVFDSDPVSLDVPTPPSGIQARRAVGAFSSGSTWAIVDPFTIKITYPNAPFHDGDIWATDNGGSLSGVTFASGGDILPDAGFIVT